MEEITITKEDLKKYYDKAFDWVMSHYDIKDSNDLDSKIIGVIYAMKREESR